MAASGTAVISGRIGPRRRRTIPGRRSPTSTTTSRTGLPRRRCATTPAAAGHAFNVIDADYFRWRDVWDDVAAFFGVEAGDVETRTLAERFAAMAPRWAEMARREQLVETDIARVGDGGYGDATLGVWWDDMCSTAKIRAFGFDPVFTSRQSLLDALGEYRRRRVIP